MERTESMVVQVAPDYENTKIKEMEMFGWNLQGRREIHEEGEAYGSPSSFSNTYIIKTRVSKYVKLHFVRSLSLPKLDQIKKIESEYFNLPFPSPQSLKWPVIFTLLAVIGGIGMLSGGDLGGLFVLAVWIPLGYVWINSRMKKSNKARQTCEQSLRKMKELEAQLKSLD